MSIQKSSPSGNDFLSLDLNQACKREDQGREQDQD
jgi:hypothetical protein